MTRSRQNLGPILRSARLSRELTQAQLAAKCGMSQHHISRLETGKLGVSVSMFCRLTKAMGATVTIAKGEVSIY